jgi:aspartokinase
MPKIPINGLKLNGPLVALWIGPSDPGSGLIPKLCRLLAAHCVNIAYMTSADALVDEPGLYCIDQADRAKVMALLDGDPQLTAQVCVGRDVGLITFYPHRSSFKTLGLVLQLLAEQKIGIHGLASSISALSFVVDFDHLETAGAILAEQLALPDNATPPWSTIKTRQAGRRR